MSLEILQKYGIKAKKSLGQNFLVNEKILDEIIKNTKIENKNILEIGPGYGALTEKIINKKPLSLNLIELDLEMVNIIKTRIKKNDLDISGINFNIENIDILKYEPKFLEKYSVIANIPYYITSPILRHFLYNIENKPEEMLILMQKDVGDKILLNKKNKTSVLSLFVQKKCEVKEILLVGKQNFFPKPKVESSVLKFSFHNLYEKIEDELFLKIIKIGFKERRKKLLNNFIKGGFEKELILNIFSKLKIENNIRGEDLNIAKWSELILEINKKLTKKTCS